MRTDARNICELLVREGRGVVSAHVVDVDGCLLVSAPRDVDGRTAAEVSRLGKQVARLDRPRPCMRSTIDERLACIAMETGDGEALVLIFFDEPDVPARLAPLMARAVAHLRTRAREFPPRGGGTGGTPSDAHAFVSLRDLGADVDHGNDDANET